MEKTIHLQGVGEVQATEAENIIVGTTLLWNFGNKSKVTDIKPRGKQQLIFTTISESGIFKRLVGKKTLLAYE